MIQKLTVIFDNVVEKYMKICIKKQNLELKKNRHG